MSQASTAAKAEPEAAATTPATPTTQTPTTSYTSTAWTSSRSYHLLCRGVWNLTAQSHQKFPSILFYSNSLRMPRRLDTFVTRIYPHPDHRPQYYAPFQHSHYPQASYGHYQPYIPPAQTAQTQTPGPVTAAVQRQETSQLDTTDVATLNDAIGSAGVDLRVRACTISYIVLTLIPLDMITGRRRILTARGRSTSNVSPI
jgi:hypothetical protein